MIARNAAHRNRRRRPGAGGPLLAAFLSASLAACSDGPEAVPYVPPPAEASAASGDSEAPIRIDGTAGGVIVRVNDHPITDWELEQRLPPPYRDRDRWSDPAVAKIVLRTVRNMAEHRILIDAAREFGITVTDAEVEKEIRKERGDLKLTPEEYKRQVEQQSGRPYRVHLDDVREQLLIQKLIGRQMYGLYVPPRQIRSQYVENPDTFTEEATVTFRLLSISSARAGGKAKAKALADAIRRQLDQGADFEAVCGAYRAYTDGATGAGKTLSNVPRGRLPAAIERILFDPDTPAPGYSPVLPFDSDWAIFHLLAGRDSRVKTFEDAQLQKGISRALLHERFIARRTEILREHLQRASISLPGLFPPGYPDTRP